MRVELVSPERVVLSGEAKMVIVRTLGGGDIAFLPGHAPFLGALTEHAAKIELEDGRVIHAAVHGGFVEVSGDRVMILSDIAELAEQIDVERAKRARDTAEEHLRKEHDAEVEASLRRAHARITAAGGLPAGPGAARSAH